ncbi:hypothetical protein [Ornithinibacillus gellani]|nr:hypothetical protein [Ornithinibacillus gellani]
MKKGLDDIIFSLYVSVSRKTHAYTAGAAILYDEFYSLRIT